MDPRIRIRIKILRIPNTVSSILEVPDGSCLHLPDEFLVRHHHWRLLDNLLVAPLDGAITATTQYIMNIRRVFRVKYSPFLDLGPNL
jgi:hypothetical protein